MVYVAIILFCLFCFWCLLVLTAVGARNQKTYNVLRHGEWKFYLHSDGRLVEERDGTMVIKCQAPYTNIEPHRWDYVNRRFYIDADVSPKLRVVLSYSPYTDLWRHEDPMWFEKRA